MWCPKEKWMSISKSQKKMDFMEIHMCWSISKCVEPPNDPSFGASDSTAALRGSSRCGGRGVAGKPLKGRAKGRSPRPAISSWAWSLDCMWETFYRISQWIGKNPINWPGVALQLYVTSTYKIFRSFMQFPINVFSKWMNVPDLEKMVHEVHIK